MQQEHKIVYLKDVDKFVKEVCEEMMNSEVPVRYWFYGETGSGKTLTVKKIAKATASKIYRKNCSKYWKNYNQEKIVLIDGVNASVTGHLARNIVPSWPDYNEFTAYEGMKRLERTTSNDIEDTKLSLEDGNEIKIDGEKYHLFVTSQYPLNVLNSRSLMDEDEYKRLCRFFKVVEFRISEKSTD